MLGVNNLRWVSPQWRRGYTTLWGQFRFLAVRSGPRRDRRPSQLVLLALVTDAKGVNKRFFVVGGEP